MCPDDRKTTISRGYYTTSTETSCGACCFLLFFFVSFCHVEDKTGSRKGRHLIPYEYFLPPPQLFFYWYLMESPRIKGTSG